MTKPSNLVVLDGYALNPGDLSWNTLSALGSLTTYDRSTADQIVARAGEADVVLTNKVPFDRATLERLPKLKCISVMATGYDVVDVAAARHQNIAVTNVPVYSTHSVAQMVFAHLLNLTQRVAHHATTVQDGRWAAADDWCYWDSPLQELNGSIFGIIGLGRIGLATAAIANAFGMRVIAATQTAKDFPDHIELTNFETIFKDSDVVSLHCPLTDQTRGLVNRERLSWMKPSAYLINTSRGALIDEVALAEALKNGRLAGAGLDILCTEPPPGEHPLYAAANCYITPHIAWATLASRQRLMDEVTANVAAFLRSEARNVVN